MTSNIKGAVSVSGALAVTGATTLSGIVSATSGIKLSTTALSYPGTAVVAITVPDADTIYAITSSASCAFTLAAPTDVTHDGMRLFILDKIPLPHTITYTAGWNMSGSQGDVATFSSSCTGTMSMLAYNGKWHVTGLNYVTLG